MKLVYIATRQEVAKGDKVKIERNGVEIEYEVDSIEKPRHGGSTGRVYVKEASSTFAQGYYPTVIGAEWIDRDDQD